MNTKLKATNERIAKTMQAKAPQAKASATPKTTTKRAGKPAVKKTVAQPTTATPAPEPQAPVTLAKTPTAPKAPRKPAVKKIAAQTTEPAPANEPQPIAPVVETQPAPANEPQPIAPVVETQPAPAAPLSADKPAQKFVIRAGNLKAALKAVDRARGKNSSLPILSQTLIETLDGAVRFTATNLDFTLWQLAQANILQSGRVAVPELLGDVLAKVNDDLLLTLTTDAKTHNLGVQAGRASVALHATDANEFPQAQGYNGKSIVIGADLTHETVNEITKRVAPFASTDDARPVLTGLSLSGALPAHSGENTTLTFVSADGFRLSVLERDATLHFDKDRKPDPFRVIVPARIFAETLKVATDPSKPIHFRFHLQQDANGVLERGMVQIETHAGGLRMNLLEGNFPDYTKIMPQGVSAMPYLPLPAEETLAALGRAALFNEAQSAQLMALPSVNLVMLSAHGSDAGDFVETLPAVYDAAHTPAERFEIAFNANFLMDALRAATYKDGDKPVLLRVTTPGSPAVLSTPRFCHVLMPMHLGDHKRTPSKTEPKPDDKPETPKAESKAETPKPQPAAKDAPKANGNGHTTPKPNGKAALTPKPVMVAKKQAD